MLEKKTIKNYRNISSKEDKWNYFLVFFFLLVESSPFFFSTIPNRFFSILAFLIVLLSIKNPILVLNKKMYAIVIVVMILMILQFILYSELDYAVLYKPIWVFYGAFLLYKKMGLRFFQYLRNIIWFTSIYTSVLYLGQVFIPPFNNFMNRLFILVYPYTWADWPRTLLFYSIPRDTGKFFFRNSGIFHESGAYACFLMLAIILNYIYSNQALSKKNIFLSLVMLSTLSTTGYIMLFLYYGYFVMVSRKNFITKGIIITVFIFTTTHIFLNTDFLTDKLKLHYQMQSQSIAQNETNVRGRFYAAGMAVKSLGNSPFVGRGIDARTRIEVGETGAFGYGLLGFLAKYGLLFGLLYSYFLIKGYRKLIKSMGISKHFAYVAFIIINLGLSTQNFFLLSSFTYFFYIGLFDKEIKI